MVATLVKILGIVRPKNDMTLLHKLTDPSPFYALNWTIFVELYHKPLLQLSVNIAK